MGLGCKFQHVGVYCIPKSSPPYFQLQSLLCYVRDWRFPASERPQSSLLRANQPLPRRALSPTPSLLPGGYWRLRSTQQPGCELARQCHGGFLPFFTLPLPPLSVTSNPNGERDIGRCCPGIRSKLYSCLSLLPCTF